MDQKLEIPLVGSSVNIVRKCGPGLKDIIRMKFGCVADIRGVDLDSDLSMPQQRKPTTTPEKRFSAVLNSGVNVSVWKADLTNFSADAVVNAANNRLQHYGGLALALSEAGGPQIQKDSDDYIKRYGDLQTGNAIVCDAGSQLPCKSIIHAVGPQLNKKFPDISKGERLLEKTINSILHLVMKNQLNTVAIPAISSGLFNYPLTKCANTIVSTVKQNCENRSHPGRLPQEIFFVNNDEPTVKEMERACREILTPHMPMTYSEAAGSRSSGAAKQAPTVKIGNVALTLKKGKIEEQQTDVIVNTTAQDLNLEIGRISKALLEKAGPGIQQELRRTFYNGCVIATNSYSLQCKEVYHTVCTENGKSGAHRVLYDSVMECLMRAAACKYSSIAFPAIGTGALGFKKEEAAKIMSEAVALFAERTGITMDVHFVIFPYDDETYKAFMECMKSLHQKLSDFTSQDALEFRDDFHVKKHTSPQINLSGPSSEAVHEAKQWLSNLVFKSSDTIHISNNFIQHFGEREYQQLSCLTTNRISIEESFVKGHASITVKGNPCEDVVVAGLQVEAMLCKVQRDFVAEEEDGMKLMSLSEVSVRRKTVNCSDPLCSDIVSPFKRESLRVVKVEIVENPALETLFDMKKAQLNIPHPLKMFQRVPAQFCEMVCHVGFHAEFAPPEEPAFGEGIYFARKVQKALRLWKENKEKYLYFVEADVLIGNSTDGKHGLILPPEGKDPHTLYHSVTGGADIAVIFSRYQALPRRIVTCEVN